MTGEKPRMVMEPASGMERISSREEIWVIASSTSTSGLSASEEMLCMYGKTPRTPLSSPSQGTR